MNEFLIDCPNCGHPIELTEALAGPLLESERRNAVAEIEKRLGEQVKTAVKEAEEKARRESEAVIAGLKQEKAASDIAVARAREAELAALKAKQDAEEAKRSIDLEVARQVAEHSAALTATAREEAARKFSTELEDARRASADKDVKLAEAQAAEIEARRAKREAEEAKRELGVLLERRLDEERAKVRDQALKERDDEFRLKLQDKERQLADLKEKLEEAQRKADQGSQQLQGDVLEVDLCDALSAAFPGDLVERVKKGQKGGDLIHTVRSSSGLVCGRIKWESKRTQNWNNAWLPKIREDQREHKCDVAALMTDALPDDVASFDLIEGVWVSGIPTAVPMEAALRLGLIETATARRAVAGADSAKDHVYRYLIGQEFRARVQGLIEPVVEMRTALESEKRAAARQFASREKQIERVGMSLAGMYGDLQGIVGSSLQTVSGLGLPEPDGPTDASALIFTQSPSDPAAGTEVH